MAENKYKPLETDHDRDKAMIKLVMVLIPFLFATAVLATNIAVPVSNWILDNLK